MEGCDISEAHFQLTGRCNLRCIFCGQQNGMFDGNRRRELPPETWLGFADQLAALPVLPKLMLWGGEPLVYEGFDELSAELFRRGFRLSIVTNGTLIDRHVEVLRRCFETIHISLDGGRADHDRIRGKGVFDRVAANLPLLAGRRGRLVFLTTVADETVGRMAELPFELVPLKPDEIVLQELMYCSGHEAKEYRAWLRREFDSDDPGILTWVREEDAGYMEMLRRQCEAIRSITYPVPVRVRLHEHCSGVPAVCPAPWSRCHIRYDGEMLFCTDFYGFSAGNVCARPLLELFGNERSQRFRREIAAGHNPLCRHCAWLYGL